MAVPLGIENSLFLYLSGLTALTDLVGDQIERWKSAQPSAPPRVTYKLLEGERIETLSGNSGLSRPVFRIQCWGADTEQAQTIANLIRGDLHTPALDGFRGWLGGQAQGHFAQCIRVKDAADDPDPPFAGDDTGSPMVALDVQIFYEEG